MKVHHIITKILKEQHEAIHTTITVLDKVAYEPPSPERQAIVDESFPILHSTLDATRIDEDEQRMLRIFNECARRVGMGVLTLHLMRGELNKGINAG